MSREDIIHRRFGSRHKNPCNNPATITCARWECQLANECRESPLAAQWRKLDARRSALEAIGEKE